jgi:hypothetical protein
MRKTRPAGITVLSLLLAWLAIGGVGNAVIWNLPEVQELMARLPSAQRIPTPGGLAFSAVCLMYGVAAGVASVALWRMHRTARVAYAAWCLTVLLTGLYWVAAGFEQNWQVSILFCFGITAFVALGIPYIAAKTNVSQPGTSPAQP